MIRGAAERYTGDDSTSVLRAGIAPRDVAEPGGPYTVYPVGDIDGDGFSDTQLLMLTLDESELYSPQFHGLLEYGGQLPNTMIR